MGTDKLRRRVLTRPEIIEASRGFVCIRLNPYEDADSNWRVWRLIGKVQNTAIALIAADAPCLRADSFPTPADCAFGPEYYESETTGNAPDRWRAAMHALVERDPQHAEAGPPPEPPWFSTLEQALPIASCDTRALVIVGAQSQQLDARLGQLSERDGVRGLVHFVRATPAEIAGAVSASTDDDVDEHAGAHRQPDDATRGSAVLVVAPDTYGRGAQVLATAEADADIDTLAATLAAGIAQFGTTWRKADRGTHIRTGLADGIRWSDWMEDDLAPLVASQRVSAGAELAITLRTLVAERVATRARGEPVDDEADRDIARRAVQVATHVPHERRLAIGMLSRGASLLDRRLAALATLVEDTLSGDDARVAWERAATSVHADPRSAYPDHFALGPQLGLLPLGIDPDTGLLACLDVLSGMPPIASASGERGVDGSTGVVFVLLPGGTFSMGAQSDDERAPHHDPQALPDEGPVHDVTLAPYFVAMHELTRGQWRRSAGFDGAAGDARPADDYPQHDVSWLDLAHELPARGWAIPTEAQWEHAARGGRNGPFPVAVDDPALSRYVNVRDRSYSELTGEDGDALDDGQAQVAPVGADAPNGYGLHGMHGGLWEWCQDGYDADYYAISPAYEPRRAMNGCVTRVCRGGNYRYGLASARSSARGSHPADVRGWMTARLVRPLAESPR